MKCLKNIFLKLNKVKNQTITKFNKFNQEFINVYSVKHSNHVMFVIQKESQIKIINSLTLLIRLFKRKFLKGLLNFKPILWTKFNC